MKIKLAASATLAVLLSATAAFAQTDTLEVVSGPTGQRAVTLAFYTPIGQSFTAINQHLTSFGFQFEALNPSSANLPITFQLLAGEGLGGSIITSQTVTLPTSINSRTATWFDFDLTGNMLSMKDVHENETRYKYDGLYRVVKTELPVSASATTGTRCR